MKLSTLLVLALALLAIAGAIRYVGGMGACAWYGHQTEREVRYSGFVGCMVKTNHGWTPRNELRTAVE